MRAEKNEMRTSQGLAIDSSNSEQLFKRRTKSLQWFEKQINVRELGIKGDGKTDVTELINQAIAFAVERGAALYFPAGKYVISKQGILLSSSNIGLIGESKETVIFLPRNKTSAFIQNTQSVRAINNILIKNISFNCRNGTANANYALRLYGENILNVTIDSCIFINIKHKYIQCKNVRFLKVSNSLFTHSGEPQKGTYITLLSGENILIDNNEFSGYYNGIYISPQTEINNLVVRGNVFDGRWYLTKEYLSGESEAVTYTGNTITDQIDFTSHVKNFDKEEIGLWRLIRVFSARGHGVGRISGREVIDPHAQFKKWGVIPGEVIEVESRRGIIAKVISNTKLEVEYWYDIEDFSKVSLPDKPISYMLYAVYLGKITSFKPHTIMVECWHDLNGDTLTPRKGSRYELIRQLPMYGLHMTPLVSNVLIESNRFLRNYADQISLFGGDAIVRNNYIKDGQDMGITVWNKNNKSSVIVNNHIERQGTCGITVNGNGNTVSYNKIVGPLPTVYLSNYKTLGGIQIVGGANNTIKNNIIDLKKVRGNGHGIVVSEQIKNINSIAGNQIEDTSGNSVQFFQDSNRIYNKWQQLEAQY